MEPKRIARPTGGEPPVEAITAATVGPRWTFVKQQGVAQTLRFADGSEFKFRKIKTDQGILSSSNVTTTDEKLAKNLRSLAEAGKNGVVEITP